MSPTCEATDILQIAIEMEQNGAEFYEKAAQTTTKEAVRDLFTYLAGEEKKHENIFADMLQKATASGSEYRAPFEVLDVLRSFVNMEQLSSKRFAQQLGKVTTSEEQVLEVGLDLEKDSIIFLQHVKDIVIGDDVNVVDQMLTEERSHFLQLTKMMVQK